MGNGTKTPLEVLEEQYKSFQRLLGHMARGMSHQNATAAEELVQDTMARMIRLTVEGRHDPTALPFATAARRHMANRRKHHASKAPARRTDYLGPDENMDDRASPGPDPEQTLIETEITGDLYEVIYSRLPEEGNTRRVYDASREGINGEEEQMEHLGLTRDQVHNARATIRKRMREVLEEHGLKMPEGRKKKVEAKS
jgi:RNA polymerase sigma factor (sigma-70 family)